MQQPVGQTWNGGHRFQMGRPGTTGPPAGDGPGDTVARVLPDRSKIVQHWPGGYKRVGDHCLSVYLSNTYCRYKRLFGTPIAFSVMYSLWKIGPIFLDLLQTFCELMIKDDFKLWWFPERLHTLTNKNSHFLGLQKVTTFVWYPAIVAEKLGYLNKWRLFGIPLFDCPPKHLVWIRHCSTAQNAVKHTIANWN